MMLYKVFLDDESDVVIACDAYEDDDRYTFLRDGRTIASFDRDKVRGTQLISEGDGPRIAPLYFDMAPSDEGDIVFYEHSFVGRPPGGKGMEPANVDVYARGRSRKGQFPTGRAAHVIWEKCGEQVLEDVINLSSKVMAKRGMASAKIDKIALIVEKDFKRLKALSGRGVNPYGGDLQMLVIEAYGNDQKIRAIQAYRDHTGVGLKEAKHAVEDMLYDLGLSDYNPKARR